MFLLFILFKYLNLLVTGMKLASSIPPILLWRRPNAPLQHVYLIVFYKALNWTIVRQNLSKHEGFLKYAVSTREHFSLSLMTFLGGIEGASLLCMLSKGFRLSGTSDALWLFCNVILCISQEENEESIVVFLELAGPLLILWNFFSNRVFNYMALYDATVFQLQST